MSDATGRGDKVERPPPTEPINPYAAPDFHATAVAPSRSDSGEEDASTAGESRAVTVHVSDDDVVDFLAHHMRRRMKLGPTVRLALPTAAAVALVDFLAWRSGRFTTGLGVLSAAWMLSVLWMGPWLWRRQLRRLARRGGPRPELTVEIGPRGLVAHAAGKAASRRSWSSVTRIDATERHFFFYESHPDADIVSVQILPRREFEGPEAAEAFLHAARRWRDEAGSQAGSGSAPDEPGPQPDQRLSVTFELTEADRRSIRRMRRVAFRREASTLAVWTAVELVLIVFLGLRIRGHLNGPGGWDQAGELAWIDLGFLVLLVGLLLPALGFWLGRVFRRPVGEVEGPIRVAITPEGFTMTELATGREMVQSWSTVRSVAEDDRYLSFGHQLIDARRGIVLQYLIPRRAFADPDEAGTFLAAARRWHAEAHEPLAGDAPGLRERSFG
jgi:hypothetical protein